MEIERTDDRPFRPARMIRVAAAITLLVTAVADDAPAMAAESTGDAKLESARRLATLLVPQAQFDESIQRQRIAFRERLLKETANKGKEAEIDALFDATIQATAKRRYDAMIAARATAMAESHTADQIEANIAFWGSDTGKAVMGVMRDPKLGEAIQGGMRDRLGMMDGLSVLNRINDLGGSVQKALADKEGR